LYRILHDIKDLTLGTIETTERIARATEEPAEVTDGIFEMT